MQLYLTGLLWILMVIASSAATVGGVIWQDLDADGSRDATETSGVSGVEVVLRDTIDTNNFMSTLTDPAGEYSFTNVAAGTYTLQLTPPTSYFFSTGGVISVFGDTGPFGVVDSDALTFDAGVFELASISGNVTWDVNGNGVQEGSETGLGGTQVDLFDADGLRIATTTTFPDGSFLFAGLNPAAYSIQVVGPDNLLFTGTGTDADGNSALVTVQSGEVLATPTAQLTAAPGCPNVDDWITAHQIDLDDFAGVSTGNVTVAGPGILGGERDVQFSIFQITTPPTQSQGASSRVGENSGQYVMDADRGNYFTRSCITWDGMDGAADILNPVGLGGIDITATDSPNIANQAFQILIDPDQMSEITIQVYSDGANMSEYVFQPTEDAEETYLIPFSGFTPAIGAGADFTSVGAIVMCIESLEEDIDVLLEIFEKVALKSALGNRVWEDLNADGVQDLGEPGLPNVPVRLYEAANPDVVFTNTLTDANGVYLFDCLPPGDYIVEFDCAPGYQQSPVDTAADSEDSDAAIGTKRSPVVTLAAGDANLTIDAGFYRPAKLGNFVWLDTDEDGQQGLGDGVSGVTVQLLDASASGSPVIDTQVTPADGSYCFENLVPGDFKVNFLWPAAYRPTIKDIGDDTSDSDADADNPMTPVVTLMSGDTNLTLDLGLVLLEPDYTLVKNLVSPADADGNPIPAEPGDPITFSIVITNTGETTLSQVPLTDSYDTNYITFLDATVLPSTATPGNLVWDDLGPLAPGEVHMVTIEFIANQSTLGQTLLNTASTTPVDALGGQPLVTKTDDAPYLIATPAFTILKERITPSGDARLGDQVVFNITVNNTGEVPLTMVPLVDTYDATKLAFASATIPPSSTTAGMLMWADIGGIPVAGQRVVTVTFNAIGSTGGATELNEVCSTPTTVSSTLAEMCADAPYRILQPSYSITKERRTPVGLPDVVGNTVTFSIAVANTGEIPLDLVPLTDTFDPDVLQFASATIQPVGTAGGTLSWPNVGPIAVGDSQSLDVTFNVVGSSGNMMLTNIVCTTPTAGNASLPQECAEAPYQAIEPAIELIKTVHRGHRAGAMCPTHQNGADDLVSGVSGEEITYCFEIRNMGDTHLTNLQLTDADLGLSSISQFNFLSGQFPLPPGQSQFYFIETTLNNDLQNVAETTGTPSDSFNNPIAGGSPLTADDDARVQLEAVSVGDFVWIDQDADGIQDPGEPGLSGARVLLKNAAGTVLDSVTTADSGRYFFTNLAPGQYKVCFELPDDCVPTITNAGAVGESSVGVQIGTTPSGGAIMETPLTAFLPDATSDLTLDQGVVKAACIGDTVWEDIGNDGRPDNDNLNTLGIIGATVNLYSVDADGNRTGLFGSEVTGAAGAYKFNNIPLGCYEVEVDTSSVPGNLSDMSTPSVYSLCVEAGEFMDTADFGFVTEPTAVEMVGMSATSDSSGNVAVSWQTGWERESLGFFVYRSTSLTGERHQVNQALLLSAGGGSAYTVPDTPGEGVTFYWVVELDTNLEATEYGPLAVAIGDTGGAVAIVETDAPNLTLGGVRVATLDTEDGLLVFAADPAAELKPAGGDPIRIKTADATNGDGTPFVVAPGSIVLDVSNPFAPVLLEGAALKGADYYAPAAKAAIRTP